MLYVCEHFVLPYFPDFRHRLKTFRGGYIKGAIAAIPQYGAFILHPADFLRLGMSQATISDWKCYHQDDLGAEEFFKDVHLEQSADPFVQATDSRPLRALVAMALCTSRFSPRIASHTRGPSQ